MTTRRQAVGFGIPTEFCNKSESTVTLNPNKYSTSTNLQGGSRGPNLKPLGVISETGIGTDRRLHD